MKSTHQATRVRFTPVSGYSRPESAPFDSPTLQPRTTLTDSDQADLTWIESSWFGAIAHQSPDLIGLVSLEGNWLCLNSSGKATLGIDLLPPLAATLDQTMQHFWHDTVLPQVIESGHWQGEFSLLRQSPSETVWFDSQWFLVRDPYTNQPLGFATISRTIEPPDRDRQKIRFLADAAHELKTPLAVMSTSIDLLNHAQLSPERKQKHFQRLRSKIQQMSQVLNDILMLSRSEQAEFKLQPTEIDPVRFCAELIEEAQMTSDRHEIVFSAVTSLPVVQIDSGLLQQILVNLLSNSIKYSPNGGQIHCKLWIDSTQLVLQVQDSGIGIPITDQAQLFRSFYRASNASKISGTGLGLAIVKRCVDLFRGQISISSAVNVGTCFTIVLPL